MRSLLLIDATGLWSDELYSVGKSFQSSPLALLSMLREDTHPPAYYALLWAWGQLTRQARSACLLSWLAYGSVSGHPGSDRCAGGGDGGDAPSGCSYRCLLVFCSPYRFVSRWRKSYALLVVLVALAWCWRRGGRLLPYGLCVALAALTHFYGLFLFLSAAVWDLSRRRWVLRSPRRLLSSPRSVGSVMPLPTCSVRSGTDRSAGFRPVGGFGPFAGALAAAQACATPFEFLGPAPLGWLAAWLRNWHEGRLLDRSGLLPSLLMVLAVVLISFVKPLAFSRYFVVLLPAVVPWCAVQIASFSWSGSARWFGSALLVLMLLSWWGAGFAELDPSANGVREQDQFAAVILTGGERDRFTPRPRLFNLSDQMELAMGRIPDQPTPWQDTDDLENRLLQQPALNQLWLASSGPSALNQRRLEPSRRLLEQNRFRCEPVSERFTHALVLHCRSSATPRPD